MSEAGIVNRLIIPPGEAEKLVSQAGRIYLRDCPCRSEVKMCTAEKWEVCLLFDGSSEADRLSAKPISSAEALQVIKMTTRRGDIHQMFYSPDDEQLSEICNCCTCCCRPLHEARELGDGYQSQLHSRYIAATDAELCIGCGTCIESCFFEARQLENDVLILTDELCFGCGRCIQFCPNDAIRLEYQIGRGIPIPGLET